VKIMKALVLGKHTKNGFGNVVVQDIAQPIPSNHQVLVRIRAAAFNPADLHIITGEMKMMSPNKVPFALGVDGVGVIEQVGSAVKGLQKGDEVMFYTGLVWSGTMAEYVAVEASACAKKPASWSFEHAAASSLGLLCANLSLTRGGAGSGKRLLIHGGGGAVGTAAIVLAKHMGATVETTANGADTDYLKSLGANIVYDYKTQPLVSLPKAHYDMVLDGMGGEMLLQSLPLLKQGGTIVSLKVMTGLDDMLRQGMKVPCIIKLLMPLMFRKFTKAAAKAGASLAGVATYQDGATLEKIAHIAAQIGYQPRIDKVFTLAESKTALEYFANNKPRGKVVVLVGT
jgi:NADPH:quinone reductase-like Zn-dependent oxidoreductase